jgi:hypothetical protein
MSLDKSSILDSRVSLVGVFIGAVIIFAGVVNCGCYCCARRRTFPVKTVGEQPESTPKSTSNDPHTVKSDSDSDDVDEEASTTR